mmetsp:Transcript_529/g.2022  ORF Transcript_529/g.2022 Transcript_529/m.2022 type:complete len:254 (-) Transcript_529:103-864(-)
MLPFVKSNLASFRLRMFCWKCTKNALIVFLYASLIPSHSGWSPSTTWYHSCFASSALCAESLCPSSAFTDLDSLVLSELNLRHLLLMSPTAGPPNTLTISAVLPPSSETGKTCVTSSVWCFRDKSICLAHEFRAVPPENTITFLFCFDIIIISPEELELEEELSSSRARWDPDPGCPGPRLFSDPKHRLSLSWFSDVVGFVDKTFTFVVPTPGLFSPLVHLNLVDADVFLEQPGVVCLFPVRSEQNVTLPLST